MTDNATPFPESPVMPAMFDGGKEIRFACRKGIACWNACCSNIDISLTPYDILRLKTRLDLSSGEFLQQYTVPYEMEKDGIAGVKLRPVDNGTACRFMRPEGCDVYADRPTACRYYPVALLSMRKQGEATDTASYALVQEEHCLGHAEPQVQTVDAYRAAQGVIDYDELARGWRQLILKKKSSGPAIGKPSKRSLQLFFMACYDIDRFRAFVASEGFRATYAIPPAEYEALLTDDPALMMFAFRFLRQVLFGEMSLEVNQVAADERRERVKERQAQLEREAVERMARDEEGMYGADD